MKLPIHAGLILLLILILSTIIPAIALAATYVVRHDGTGDFPTIQAAINVCVDGDTVELGDGVFTGAGNRDVVITGVELILRSQSGNPEQCVIDCQGSIAEPHRALLYETIWENYFGLVEGITFTNGHAGYGGGVRTRVGAAIDFNNCIFRDNTAESGGGLYSVLDEGSFRGGSNSAPAAEYECEVSNCRFENNSCSGLGGGAAYAWSGYLLFTHCEFIGNSGGGLGFTYCVVTVHDCNFIDNTGGGGALASDTGFYTFEVVGCVFTNNSPTALYNDHVGEPVLANNTFWNNEHAITHTIPLPFTMSNTIIANSTVATFGAHDEATLTCCDLHGNVGGDWVGGLAGQLGSDGNICADPLFCDPGSGDFTLHSESPCAPGNSGGCGLIGALDVGCGSVVVEPSTWGAIKASFKR